LIPGENPLFLENACQIAQPSDQSKVTSSMMFVRQAAVIVAAVKSGESSQLFLLLLATTVCVVLIGRIDGYDSLFTVCGTNTPLAVGRISGTRLAGIAELTVYFGYAAVVAVADGLVCAAAGFLAANTFVRAIFRNLNLA
jgi:hypothetical protein